MKHFLVVDFDDMLACLRTTLEIQNLLTEAASTAPKIRRIGAASAARGLFSMMTERLQMMGRGSVYSTPQPELDGPKPLEALFAPLLRGHASGADGPAA